jgi:hypothetical protein
LRRNYTKEGENRRKYPCVLVVVVCSVYSVGFVCCSAPFRWPLDRRCLITRVQQRPSPCLFQRPLHCTHTAVAVGRARDRLKDEDSAGVAKGGRTSELKELAPELPHSSLLAGAMEIRSDSLPECRAQTVVPCKKSRKPKRTCPMILEPESSKQMLCPTSQPGYYHSLIEVHPQHYLTREDRGKKHLS